VKPKEVVLNLDRTAQVGTVFALQKPHTSGEGMAAGGE